MSRGITWLEFSDAEDPDQTPVDLTPSLIGTQNTRGIEKNAISTTPIACHNSETVQNYTGRQTGNESYQ